MSDFKKLLVWQRAHELVLAINHITAAMRGANYVSLRSQMVRAAMSISANIVEGRGQKSDREFARFLRISLNSTSELEYHLIVAHDFGALTHRIFHSTTAQLIEVRKMLHGLLERLDADRTERMK
jgi:four helix bundle protein